ncbi:hypothetical protein NDU88_004785 [Pleurodeles waltl]|uniref:Uncharacterized protein n=1 Tax=Pleurodeles waltl TaxID=8319 RepID=A0AAV7SJX5_PLEWA|nr:hypothetical protein NDU88_004785 [Pleurodeles waltl]
MRLSRCRKGTYITDKATKKSKIEGETIRPSEKTASENVQASGETGVPQKDGYPEKESGQGKFIVPRSLLMPLIMVASLDSCEEITELE